MQIMSKDDFDIEDQCLSIVLDHLLFTGTSKTYKILSSTFNKTNINEEKNLQARIRITEKIKDIKSEEAFKEIHDEFPGLKDDILDAKLYKQAYLEAVFKKDYKRAIDYAKECMKNGKIMPEEFCLLCSGDANYIASKCFSEEDLQSLVCEVNERLFLETNKREKSKLWYLLMQHKSVLHYTFK